MTASATGKPPVGDGDIPPAGNGDVEAFVHQGIKALDGRNFAEAARLFKRALARAPFRSDVRELLSLALDERSHSEEAGKGADSGQPIKSRAYSQTVDRARKRRHGPLEKLTRPTVLIAIAVAAVFSIFSFLRSHLSESPPPVIVDQNFETFEPLARSLYDSGSFKDAVKLIDTALMQKTIDPEKLNHLKAEFHYREALAFGKKFDFSKAIEMLEAATDLAPTDVEYHYELGRALHMKGRELRIENSLTEAAKHESAALDRLKKALEIQPDHIDSHWWITRVLQSMGKTEDMKLHLQRLIEIAPESREAKNAQEELLELGSSPSN